MIRELFIRKRLLWQRERKVREMSKQTGIGVIDSMEAAKKIVLVAEKCGWPPDDLTALCIDCAVAGKSNEEFNQIINAGYEAWIIKRRVKNG